MPGHLIKFWQAFFELNDQRQYHMSGPQALLRTEIESYLRTEGTWCPQRLVPKFFRIIRALDAEYRDLYQKANS